LNTFYSWRSARAWGKLVVVLDLPNLYLKRLVLFAGPGPDGSAGCGSTEGFLYCNPPLMFQAWLDDSQTAAVASTR